MGTYTLSDKYALSPRASGIHIRQSTRAHFISYTYSITLVFLAVMAMQFSTKATTINKIDGKGPNYELKNTRSYLINNTRYISYYSYYLLLALEMETHTNT